MQGRASALLMGLVDQRVTFPLRWAAGPSAPTLSLSFGALVFELMDVWTHGAFAAGVRPAPEMSPLAPTLFLFISVRKTVERERKDRDFPDRISQCEQI